MKDEIGLTIAMIAILVLIVVLAVLLILQIKKDRRKTAEQPSAQAPEESDISPAETEEHAETAAEEAPLKDKPEEAQESQAAQEEEKSADAQSECANETEEKKENEEMKKSPEKKPEKKEQKPAVAAQKSPAAQKTAQKPAPEKKEQKPAPEKKAAPALAAAAAQKTASGGKWIIYEEERGGFGFKLVASNGEVMLLSSAPYSSLQSAKSGIKTYQDNVSAGRLEIVETKSGSFFVKINNASGRLLATSADYKTRTSAESAAESIRRWAGTTVIVTP